MYLNIRPKRSDFGNIKIYEKDIGKKDHNYLVITYQETKEAYFVFNELNKVSIKEPIVEPVSKGLKEVFLASLEAHPRDYVFVGQDKKPFKTPNAFGKFVTRTFEHYFGKKVGTSMIRHIFINEKIDLNKLTIEEKNEVAHAMGHDRQQQEKYKLFFDK
jgi:hypothetical protein